MTTTGSAATTPYEPALVGPYRPVRRLGEGGMGVVHLALDPQGRAVALKVLRDHVCADPEARARLRREVETLRRVRSPHVAEVLAADLEGGRPYVATRFVPGPTLEEHVRASGPLAAPGVARLGVVLAAALTAIHEAGVVHRDVKPGNVLLLDGDPVLVDFGIAHVVDEARITRAGLVMGTPGYLSPEVVAGWPVTAATDWWGWGATLAFAATGRSPFGTGPIEVVLDRVRQGHVDLAGVDPRLAPVLWAALAPDPRRRSASAVLVPMLLRAGAHPPGLVVGGVAPPTSAPVPSPLPATRRAPAPARRPAPVPSPRPATRRDPAPSAPAPWPLPVGRPPAGPSPAPTTPRPATPRPTTPRPTAIAPTRVYEQPRGAGPAQPGTRGPGVQDQRRPPPPRPGPGWTTAVLVAALAAIAGGAAIAPGATLIGFLAFTVLARTADRTVTDLLRRRHERGPRASDGLVVVAAMPWRLTSTAIASGVAAVLPCMVGVATAFVVASALAGGVPAMPGTGPSLAGAGVATALVAWWGPGGGSLRRGSRALVRGVTPTRGSRAALIALLLAGALIAVGASAAGVRPDPAPFVAPSLQLWAI
ncbi:MAG: serine/threonine-protein kinase [Kineosporiaceae bacterium]